MKPMSPAFAGPSGGIDAQACIRYTIERQTTQGGFCFYTYHAWGVEEPNAPDTLAAISILSMLRQPVPNREPCVAWLRAQQDARGDYATLVIGYAALQALRKLDAAPARDPRAFLRRTAATLGLSGGRPPARDLRWLLMCLELWRENGLALADAMLPRIAALLERQHERGGGYGASGASLPETAAAVAVASELDLSINASGVLDYVRLCEGPPYGFNVASSATSSDLETQRAALWLLRRFGAAPTHPELIGRFVALCQTDAGGFGPSPGAIARLSESVYALEILGWLAQARW